MKPFFIHIYSDKYLYLSADSTFQHNEPSESMAFDRQTERSECTVMEHKTNRDFTINNILKSEPSEDKLIDDYQSVNGQKILDEFDCKTETQKISFPGLSKRYSDMALQFQERGERALFLRKKGASPHDSGKYEFKVN